jgi:hypothetical protein
MKTKGDFMIKYFKLELEINIGDWDQSLIRHYVKINYTTESDFDKKVTKLIDQNIDRWGHAKLFGFSELKSKPNKNFELSNLDQLILADLEKELARLKDQKRDALSYRNEGFHSSTTLTELAIELEVLRKSIKQLQNIIKQNKGE